MNFSSRFAALALSLTTSFGALAQSAPAADTPPSGNGNGKPLRTEPKWELGLGVGALSMPDYRGADHQSTFVVPIPYVIYRGDVIKADRSGVRGRFFDSRYLDVELSINGGVPVRSKDNEARQGMPDLKPTLEIGPQAIVRLIGSARDTTRLDLRLPVRSVIASNIRSEGYVFTPALNLSIEPAAKWHFGAQAGLYYGSRGYHQYLYEVDGKYATATRPAYSARGGYGGWQATTSLSRRFDNMWIGGFLRYSSVSGAVFEDSPLVRRKNNLYAGIGISWILARADEKVPVTDDE